MAGYIRSQVNALYTRASTVCVLAINLVILIILIVGMVAERKCADQRHQVTRLLRQSRQQFINK